LPNWQTKCKEKSPGPDGIQPRLLKELKGEIWNCWPKSNLLFKLHLWEEWQNTSVTHSYTETPEVIAKTEVSHSDLFKYKSL
jgi:hypothetical protein